MRSVVSAVLIAASIVPSQAIGSELFDQFVAARSLFAVDPSNLGDFYGTYAKEMMKGIDGVWFPIGILQEGSADELDNGRYQTACERSGHTFSIVDDFTLKAVRRAGTDTQVTTIYTARGGMSFGQFTDPAEMNRYLGFDKLPDADPVMIFNSLSNQNGIATILRPSPDILIIQTNYGVPQILARCPA